jgi:hypothetical protein
LPKSREKQTKQLNDRLGRLFRRLGLERMSRDITDGDRSFTLKIGNIVRGANELAHLVKRGILRTGLRHVISVSF